MARSMRSGALMIQLLTSDPAILAFSFFGLVATAISIVRDARAIHARPVAEELPLLDEQHDLAA